MLNFGIFGIPVQVQWTFWLGISLLSGQLFTTSADAVPRLLAWVLAAFISILWHELGHAFVLRKYKFRPHITLYHFGGYAEAAGHRSRHEQIFISIAGPANQFLLFGALWLILAAVGKVAGVGWILIFPFPAVADFGNAFVDHFIFSMLFVNLIWPIINLFPVLPLDGGKILEAALGNTQKALKISAVTGFVVAGFALFLMGQVYLGLLFGFMAVQSLQQLQGFFGGGGGYGAGPYRRR